MPVALLPLSLLFPLACTQECTLEDAPSTLTLRFDPPVSDFGLWSVVASDPASTDEVSCFGQLGGADTAAGFACDAVGPGSGLVSADPVDDTLTEVVLLGFAPDSVQLRITHDGTERFKQTLTPTWAVDEPNGAGCGERRVATETVAVP